MTPNAKIAYYYPQGASAPCQIDVMIPDAHGVLRTLILGDTIEQVRARRPGAQICTIEQLIAMQEDSARTDPQLITSREFTDAFNVLPPMGWQNLGTFECFRMSERLDGRMVRIYARVKDTHWTFVDRIDLPVQAIMGRIERKLREMVPA